MHLLPPSLRPKSSQEGLYVDSVRGRKCIEHLCDYQRYSKCYVSLTSVTTARLWTEWLKDFAAQTCWCCEGSLGGHWWKGDWDCWQLAWLPRCWEQLEGVSAVCLIVLRTEGLNQLTPYLTSDGVSPHTTEITFQSLNVSWEFVQKVNRWSNGTPDHCPHFVSNSRRWIGAACLWLSARSTPKSYLEGRNGFKSIIPGRNMHLGVGRVGGGRSGQSSSRAENLVQN